MTEKPTFYITTPIYYPSDKLHIGHAYTTVAADAMTRYKRQRGYDAYFLTGTDEHGLKIQQRATEAGMEPQAFVDGIVQGIKQLWQLLDIEYSDFIRTTEPRHEQLVQKLFQKYMTRAIFINRSIPAGIAPLVKPFLPSISWLRGTPARIAAGRCNWRRRRAISLR